VGHDYGARAVNAVDAVLVVAAYFLGTFPSAILVGRSHGVDPTTTGSGNPGATNVYRTAGKGAGIVVALADIAKGAIPAGVGWAVGGRPLGFACWIAAVLGHVFPATRSFRGGKGVATAAGGALVLLPLASLICAVAFLIAILVSRRASVGSLAMAVLLPLAALVTGRPGWEVLVCCGVSVLVIVRHASNIRRLVEGDELAV
jgi:glycerol-3-phosphate acyltransferase PlsY